MQGLPTHSVGGHTRESSNGQGVWWVQGYPIIKRTRIMGQKRIRIRAINISIQRNDLIQS